MSFNYRFEPPSTFDFEEIDDSMCDECPHRFGECWEAGKCLMEGDNL